MNTAEPLRTVLRSADAARAQLVSRSESLDVAVVLGVDPRHADQVVRGTVVLPHGTGKSVRVLVLAQGDKVREAEHRRGPLKPSGRPPAPFEEGDVERADEVEHAGIAGVLPIHVDGGIGGHADAAPATEIELRTESRATPDVQVAHAHLDEGHEGG